MAGRRAPGCKGCTSGVQGPRVAAPEEEGACVLRGRRRSERQREGRQVVPGQPSRGANEKTQPVQRARGRERKTEKSQASQRHDEEERKIASETTAKPARTRTWQVNERSDEETEKRRRGRLSVRTRVCVRKCCGVRDQTDSCGGVVVVAGCGSGSGSGGRVTVTTVFTLRGPRRQSPRPWRRRHRPPCRARARARPGPARRARRRPGLRPCRQARREHTA